ncbi:ribosomal L18p/L5e family [Burkholderia pseudomallei 406e]|nr:ribosomal L18p/L5e family [Burkholderia pseudomallei 406e]EDS83969.1 hypothetical protein BURPSS13_F0270 [Burkholderia pseudomallei S13]EDU11440.1 hypothetical protein BURPS1655_F0033 [Burkholderia pseudomallei 1655]
MQRREAFERRVPPRPCRARGARSRVFFFSPRERTDLDYSFFMRCARG